jgi:hypothetical protein
MKSSQLRQLPLLIQTFGKSNVFETARVLRDAGLLGSGSEQAGVNDLAGLLLCLCLDRKVGDALAIRPLLPLLRSQGGAPFYEVFAAVINGERVSDDFEHLFFSKSRYHVEMGYAGNLYHFTLPVDHPLGNIDAPPGLSHGICLERTWIIELRQQVQRIMLENTLHFN